MENDVTLFLPKFKLAEEIPIKWSAQKSKKYELPMKNRKMMKTWTNGIHFFHARITVESPFQHPGAGEYIYLFICLFIYVFI